MNNCIEVNNIGTVENPIYSCNKCLNDGHVKLTNENNIIVCDSQINELTNCLEAKKESGKKICTKCKYGLIPSFSTSYSPIPIPNPHS